MYPGQYSKQRQYCIVTMFYSSCRQSCGVSVVSSLLTSALLVLAYKAVARDQICIPSSFYTALSSRHRVNTSTLSNATDPYRSNESNTYTAICLLCSEIGQMPICVGVRVCEKRRAIERARWNMKG